MLLRWSFGAGQKAGGVVTIDCVIKEDSPLGNVCTSSVKIAEAFPIVCVVQGGAFLVVSGKLDLCYGLMGREHDLCNLGMGKICNTVCAAAYDAITTGTTAATGATVAGIITVTGADTSSSTTAGAAVAGIITIAGAAHATGTTAGAATVAGVAAVAGATVTGAAPAAGTSAAAGATVAGIIAIAGVATIAGAAMLRLNRL
ncbi:hypothetical protein BJV78DRAFT_1287758 [Lactifluus subvellereus]|nr:hypothetical protein BJV78DRAFT_1287758 [Lactifluus subvellereus]